MKTSVLFLALFCVCSSVFSSTVPGYVPTNGLVGWWPFTGNANDQSGNGNNGTASGATLTTDRFGVANAAYSFDGVTNNITGNASAFPTGDRTVSLWYYSTNVGTGMSGRQLLGYGGGNCNSFLMRMTSPAVDPICGAAHEVNLHCGFMLGCVGFGNLSPNGVWRHWVVTTSQSGTNFYLDGTYVGGVTSGPNTSVFNTIFVFGGCPNSSGTGVFNDAMSTPWNGKLDDIGVWNRALTQAEIAALFSGGSTGLSNLGSDSGVRVFPNPGKERVSVSLSKNHMGQPFTVLDAMGRKLMNGIVSAENINLETGNWNKGIYFFRLEGLEPSTLKFIVD